VSPFVQMALIGWLSSGSVGGGEGGFYQKIRLFLCGVGRPPKGGDQSLHWGRWLHACHAHQMSSSLPSCRKDSQQVLLDRRTVRNHFLRAPLKAADRMRLMRRSALALSISAWASLMSLVHHFLDLGWSFFVPSSLVRKVPNRWTTSRMCISSVPLRVIHFSHHSFSSSWSSGSRVLHLSDTSRLKSSWVGISQARVS
jgi:hypothetical protein